MTFHAWLAFVLATAVLLAIPGPTTLMVIGQSLGAGRRHALPLVAGVALGAGTAFRRAYVVTALNPKGISFFVAFVPQFMAPFAPFLPQAAILVVSFVTMASATALLWTALAGRVSSLVRRPSARRGFNRAGGGVLVGAGVALALKR